MAISHEGRGANNWALHYYLQQDGLALFIQEQWGGAYTDQQQAALRLRAIFAAARRLIDDWQSAGAAAQTRPGRLIVVSAPWGVSRWGWASAAGEIEWSETRQPLTDSLAALAMAHAC